MIDSSTSAAPSATAPSAGTRAPGRTRPRSPTRRSEVGTISVPAEVTRSASSGNSSASALSAPWACMIERISSQWPRLMTVMSVASPQTSTSKTPRVAARLVTKATTIARLISVIIPGWRSPSSARAPERNPAAIDEDDGAEDRRDPLGSWVARRRVAEPHLDLGLQMTTGMVRSRTLQNWRRNASGSCPACCCARRDRRERAPDAGRPGRVHCCAAVLAVALIRHAVASCVGRLIDRGSPETRASLPRMSCPRQRRHRTESSLRRRDVVLLWRGVRACL